MPDAMSEVFASGIPNKGDIADARHDVEALRVATKTDSEAFRVETKADFVAIRHDIDALRTSTKSDIEALLLSTHAGIATAKSDIIKWMFGMSGFQTVAVLGAVVALVRSPH